MSDEKERELWAEVAESSLTKDKQLATDVYHELNRPK